MSNTISHQIDLQLLLDKKNELLGDIDAIDRVLKLFNLESINLNGKANGQVKNNEGKNVVEPSQTQLFKDNQFPQQAKPDVQIDYLLRHVLKKATRYPELQSTYEKATGTKRVLRPYTIDLRKSGKIASIRYNGNDNKTYLGLPEWVEETENGARYKSDFFEVNEVLFPEGIWQTERYGTNTSEKQEGHPDGQP